MMFMTGRRSAWTVVFLGRLAGGHGGVLHGSDSQLSKWTCRERTASAATGRTRRFGSRQTARLRARFPGNIHGPSRVTAIFGRGSGEAGDDVGVGRVGADQRVAVGELEVGELEARGDGAADQRPAARSLDLGAEPRARGDPTAAGLSPAARSSAEAQDAGSAGVEDVDLEPVAGVEVPQLVAALGSEPDHGV